MRVASFCLLALLAPGICAQSLSFGVKGGVPLTSAIDGGTFTLNRYTVGPMVEIGLPFSLAIEADALYRRTGYDAVAGSLGTVSNFRVRANSWEFPVLAKYYFGPRIFPVRFYATGGYAIRYVSGLDPSNRPYVRDNPVHGAVAGAGARFHWHHFSVAPEVRYTHWSGMTFNQYGPYGFSVQSTQNQADFLVGVTF